MPINSTCLKQIGLKLDSTRKLEDVSVYISLPVWTLHIHISRALTCWDSENKSSLTCGRIDDVSFSKSMCLGRIQHEEPPNLFRPSPHGCPWDGAQRTRRNLMKQCNRDGFFSFLHKIMQNPHMCEIQDFSRRPFATQVASQMFQHHRANTSIDIHIYGQWISTSRKHQHYRGQLLQVFDVCFSVKPDSKLIICLHSEVGSLCFVPDLPQVWTPHHRRDLQK